MSGWIGRRSTEYAWLDLNLNMFLLMLETLCKYKYIFWSGWVLSFKHETQSTDKTQQWKNTSKDWRMAAVCPWGWRSPLYSCTCCKRSCRTDFVKREVHTIVNNLNQRCPEKAANWASTPWSMNRSAKMGQESGTGARPGTWGRRSTRRKGAYIRQKFLSILAGFQYMHVILFFRV